jgi:hypothetical protein
MQLWSGMIRALALLLVVGLAGPASAIQFTPTTEALNTFASGDPGTPFNTGPGGVDYDGVGSGDPHEGEVQVTGFIPNLVVDGNTQINFIADSIQFELEAELVSTAVNIISATQAQLVLTFQGTADGNPDLVITDLDDNTVLLESNLVAGTLNGNPVAPITAQAFFDPTNIPAQPNMQAFAFFQNEVNGNPWEVLFDDGVGTLNDAGIAQTLISSFAPDFTVIASDVINTGVLPSIDAEANGFIFALTSSQFVPEPGLMALWASGLAALALARRRG